MSERSDKLVKLRDWWDLETGEPHAVAFECEDVLYLRSKVAKGLRREIRTCHKCPGMNVPGYTDCVPGWGNLLATVVFVGQSLHKPGMQSDVEFVGGSGLYVLAAVWLSGLERQDCYWTNVVKGHPPRNRPSLDTEKENCTGYLLRELEIIRPKLVVALGNDAKEAVEYEGRVVCVKHPAGLMRGAAPEARVDWIVKLSDELDKEL